MNSGTVERVVALAGEVAARDTVWTACQVAEDIVRSLKFDETDDKRCAATYARRAAAHLLAVAEMLDPEG